MDALHTFCMYVAVLSKYFFPLILSHLYLRMDVDTSLATEHVSTGDFFLLHSSSEQLLGEVHIVVLAVPI